MGSWKCRIRHRWGPFNPGEVLVSKLVAARIEATRRCGRCGRLKTDEKEAERIYKQHLRNLYKGGFRPLDPDDILMKIADNDWWKQRSDD